jgi:copper chaperone CopZ
MRPITAASIVVSTAVAAAIAIYFVFEADQRSSPTVLIMPTIEVAYAVEGMHCDGCAQAIVAEVSEVKGVRSVKCTFESKQAVIVLDDAASLAEAERAITKLGYTISPAAAATAPAASAQLPASR